MSKQMRMIVGLFLMVVLMVGGITGLLMGTRTSYAAGPTPVTTNPFTTVAPPPNCTWWAWQRLHNVLGVDLQFYQNDNANAYNWANLLASRQPYAAWSERLQEWVQLQFTSKPSVNDIVVIPANKPPYSNSLDGHVAYVENAPGGDLFDVSEQNASGKNWLPPSYMNPNHWSTSQVVSLGGKFIHIVLSGSAAVHNPVAVRNNDGRMEVFQVGSNGQLYYQSEDLHGNWQGWHSLGGNWPGQPAVVANFDGRLEVFIVGNQGPTGGGLFHAWQTRAGDDTSWTAWSMLAGAWPPGTPAVAHNLSGGLEVFMRGMDQNLYHCWQTTSGNSSNYSGWSPMGGTWDMDPVVANNANGTMQVFLVGLSTQLYYSQEASNGNWSGWQLLGGSWPSQPAVLLNASHELEVFIVGNQGPTGGGLFHAWQVSPENGTWTGWSMLPGGWHAGTPFVAKNTNGTMDVFLTGQGGGSDTALYHDYEHSDGSWSGPYSLGGYWQGEPSVTRNLPGGLETFMLGMSGQIYHAWENTAGNSTSYSGWYTLGMPQ